MDQELQAKRFVETLMSDFKLIHNESKKKFPAVKEAIEGGILRLRMVSSQHVNVYKVLSESNDIFRPLLLACDTKTPKIASTALTSIQRLASSSAIGEGYAPSIVNQLWELSNAGVEELRVLQTILILITTSPAVQKDSLAKTVVICFHLYFSSDSTISSTAAATIRQSIAVILDRMVEEDKIVKDSPAEVGAAYHSKCPRTLYPQAQDAYLLFQDLCQITSGDSPYWLVGIKEMTRTFGLELLESVLKHYPNAFLQHPEFCYLLKERVCPLIIKLFSPNIKFKQGGTGQATVVEKPVFPVSMRLLRIVSILIKQFYTLLVTECEIFLSLLVKFLDADKPFWQRALALEVLHSLCVQPQLLRSFCQFYDLQEHSTKVFHEICLALEIFIQSMFSKEAANLTASSLMSTQQSSTNQNTAFHSSSNTSDKMTQQPGFSYKGVWIPIGSIPPSGISKPVYLEQLDFKGDIAAVSETYAMSISVACALEIARAIDVLVHSSGNKRPSKSFIESCKDPGPDSKDKTGVGSEAMKDRDDVSIQSNDEENIVWKEMVKSSWDSLQSTLQLLLEASIDETITENILKAIQTYASVSGQLSFTSTRDSFVSCLCKSAIPASYLMSVMSSSKLDAGSNQHSSHAAMSSSASSQTLSNHSTSSGIGVSANGNRELTAKNIQCMRAILSLAHCHGDVLGTAWYMVLQTLQHLTVILGLKFSASGSLKGIQANDLPSLVMSQSLMSELPVLSAMLSRLFESTKFLDDVALHHLVNALCRLSSEEMEHASNNKDPCLFPVAKLQETQMVNLSRLKVLWKPLTAHLLEVSQHTHSRLREWGADALTGLVRSAMTFDFEMPINGDLALQQLILHPLQEMANISYTDVRQQQYECVLQLLHDSAPNLGPAWPLMLHIIGLATNQQNETIIRQGFQSLQLVVTDYLPIMPCWCLQILIDVVGQFGLQPQEINISLTAVGLLWNLSDFFYQNRTALKLDLANAYKQHNESDASDDEKGILASLIPSLLDKTTTPFDSLWMCLFSKLGDLCVDPRPAVRKSAGQTLFSTISAHGGLLENRTWYSVLWKVLFPLLEKVKTMSSTAADVPPPSDAASKPGNILIHHSRDTAEKQWAETRVLTLAGVSRVFSTRKKMLKQLDEYPRAWALLLEMIEAGALSRNNEVALNSLKSFQDIAHEQEQAEEKPQKQTNPKKSILSTLKIKTLRFLDTDDEDQDLWIQAWRVWLSIGHISMSAGHIVYKTKDESGNIITETRYPKQDYLTALLCVFPSLLGRIYKRFGMGDVQRLCEVVRRAVAIPIHTSSSPFLVPSFNENCLSSLQQIVIFSLNALREPVTQFDNKSILESSSKSMYPVLFETLLAFVEYSCCPPKIEPEPIPIRNVKDNRSLKNKQGGWSVMNYVPFSEESLRIIVDLYEVSHKEEAVIEARVLEEFIKVVRLPLKLKYACPSQSTWNLAVESFMKMIRLGLPVHLQSDNKERNDSSLWKNLADALEDFLFSNSPPPEGHTFDQHKADEQLDITVVTLIRDEILAHANSLPKEFIDRLMKLLNRGSIHSAASGSFDVLFPFLLGDSLVFPVREDFAKICFQALLQYSFVSQKEESTSGSISKLALCSLVQRCKDVLSKFTEDERLQGQFPLPRARMAEMSFAIKAVSTLMTSLKRANQNMPDAIERSMWEEVIAIYPTLLDCVTCNSTDVRYALKDALKEFSDLLAVPRKVLEQDESSNAQVNSTQPNESQQNNSENIAYN
ncbi:protein MON2 homolog isoform X1 [Rhopilema esculentum]|uniref:protein MON2 homolog isoform X1 n=1 Tax=Rhopilema esculentum TaxID=499914 RepID=UPI0031D734FC